jgi:predicted nucleic acid-binding protein
MNYLIDTNVISELVSAKPNPHVVKWLNQLPINTLHLSVLTIGEIRKGIEKVTDAKRKEKLLFWLEHELTGLFMSRMLPISLEVADRWGRLIGSTRHSVPAIDSLIAATALHYDLALVTRNVKDFNFPGLEVINPWGVV